MPEQFTPVAMSDNSGVALDAGYFNRLEAAHELADDRVTALERGVVAPITITYAATITPDATQGSCFRCVATGNLTLNGPSGGIDGQTVTVRIKASGANRTVSFEGGTTIAVTIAAGQWWTGQLTYYQPDDTWILAE